MSVVQLELDEDLAAVLRQMNQPMAQAARELMVMELYRRGEIWRGKAAALLGMPLLDFIRRAADLGIPYFEFTEEEWEAELEASKKL